MYAHAYAQGLKLSSAGTAFRGDRLFRDRRWRPSPTTPRFCSRWATPRRHWAWPRRRRNFSARFWRRSRAGSRRWSISPICCAHRGQFEAARALLEPALARHPKSPELHLTLGSVWREVGRPRTGQAFLSRGPGRFAPITTSALVQSGRSFGGDDGDFEAARTLYDRAIKAGNGHAQTRLNRAILHFLIGNLKEGWRDYAARTDMPGKVPVTDLKLRRMARHAA